MQIKASRSWTGISTKTWLVMKLTVLLMMVATLQVTARGFGQTVTFSGREVPLKTVFKAIHEQSGYVIFYDNALLRSANPVTVDVKNMPLQALLNTVLNGQGLSYTIVDKTISIKKMHSTEPEGTLAVKPPPDLRGLVVDEAGKPVANVTVTIKGTNKMVQTDAKGAFTLKDVPPNAVLLFSAVNIDRLEVPANGRLLISVTVKTKISELDEIQIIGYGTTTRRTSTSSTGHVSSEEIAKQPVINPLQALQGRVPGLIVTQTSGLGSASFNVQIRGQSSFTFASDPLFVIDGVPMMAGGGDAKNPTSGESKNLGLNQNFMVTGVTQSPLYSMNPSDIESIDVLKDADATAIYGSQGANGVILITTKRGKPGKTKFDINAYSGAGKVTRMTKLLNTQQYLDLRKEAYRNANATPLLKDAPDLLKWDQNRYTDWQKMLIGNTAHTTDGQAGFSGGDEYTQYRVSGGFHRQTDVTTASGSDKRVSLNFNLNNVSRDRKFRMSLSGSYSNINTNTVPFDNSLIVLPPNAPSVFDSLGRLNFTEWGYYNSNLFGLNVGNPFGVLLQSYSAITDNLQSNINLQYQPVNRLTLRVTGGYSMLQNNQLYVTPKASMDPNSATAPVSKTQFGGNGVKTWIVEPQAEYYTFIGSGKLSVLVGSTFQNTITKGLNGTATDFSNEALLRSVSAAKTFVIYSDTYTPYRYQAVFGRINYAWANKYIINATARRDGSSRFGPGRQFGNFGALGTAWIFSEEPFVRKAIPFLSFGKLRGSYGITGSANIGDYNYLSRWGGNTYNYQSGTLSPTQHYNPDYNWEENKKLEFGMELGFLKDRIQLLASWFRNRCDNELVQMQLPVYTGFPSVNANLPGLIQNMGWEFSLASTNFKTRNLTWTSSFNISFIRNKLLAYPNLSTSPYALLYTIGQPMSMQRLLHFQGINPQTGAVIIEDVNKDGKIMTSTALNDLKNSYDKAPAFYGGLNNAIQYKNWQLSFFFQYTRQKGYINKFSLAGLGTINNQPLDALNHWRQPGDNTNLPKAATVPGTDYSYYLASDAALTDASYIRLQNLSLAFTLPASWAGKYLAQYTRVYVQGQNLLTITNYKGADPETQGLTSVPPVKFLTAGIQITF